MNHIHLSGLVQDMFHDMSFMGIIVLVPFASFQLAGILLIQIPVFILHLPIIPFDFFFDYFFMLE